MHLKPQGAQGLASGGEPGLLGSRTRGPGPTVEGSCIPALQGVDDPAVLLVWGQCPPLPPGWDLQAPSVFSVVPNARIPCLWAWRKKATTCNVGRKEGPNGFTQDASQMVLWMEDVAHAGYAMMESPEQRLH